MARIRSIHPSLFTDEAWVSCSPLARVLYIGLLTEADDQGLFEWKPLQIKMRLLPIDNADVPELLAELAGADLIAPLESGGKKLGAVRKFRRFQRPKKPTKQFVLPPEWETYVGLSEGGSEPRDDEGASRGEPEGEEEAEVRNQFPTSAEGPEQKEDGGGRRSSVSDETGAAAPPGKPDDLDDLRGLEPKTAAWRLGLKLLIERGGYAESRARPLVGKWAKEVPEPGELWRLLEAAWGAATMDPAGYVSGAIERHKADGIEALARPTETRQRLWMQDFSAGGEWRRHERGPAPGEPGCRVAAEIQREFGIDPAQPVEIRGAA
jgi:hypothetical protein